MPRSNLTSKSGPDFMLPLIACGEHPKTRPGPKQKSAACLSETLALVLVVALVLCVPPLEEVSQIKAHRAFAEPELMGASAKAAARALPAGVRRIDYRGGKRMWIIDDALPEAFARDWREYLLSSGPNDDKIFAIDGNTDYVSGEGVQENKKVDHYVAEQQIDVNPLVEKLVDLATVKAQEITGEDLMGGQTMSRMYTNYIAKGNKGMVHVDEEVPGHYTLLWFCHASWHANNGAEFLAFDLAEKYSHYGNRLLDRMLESQGTSAELHQFEKDLGDADIHAVMPRPNRLVVFDSDILHSARPPQVEAAGYRLSTAIKLVSNDLFARREAVDIAEAEEQEAYAEAEADRRGEDAEGEEEEEFEEVVDEEDEGADGGQEAEGAEEAEGADEVEEAPRRRAGDALNGDEA